MSFSGDPPAPDSMINLVSNANESKEDFAKRFLNSTKKGEVRAEFEGVKIFCEQNEMTSVDEVLAAIDASRRARELITQLESGAFDFQDHDVVLTWISEVQGCEVYGAVIDTDKILGFLERLNYRSLTIQPVISPQFQKNVTGEKAPEPGSFDPAHMSSDELKLYIIRSFMYNLLTTKSIDAPNIGLWRPKSTN